MNIRLGIYEIFSRIVPGGVYLLAVVQLLVTLGVLTLDLQALNDISLIASLGLVVAAYVMGGALNPFSFVWLRLFRVKGASEAALKAFKQKYEGDWEIDIEDKDWPILLAILRSKDLELAGEIERHNALSIMMRNVSLGMGMMAGNFVAGFFLSRNTQDIFASIIIFLLALLVLRESAKFRRWYYDAVIETVFAYRIDLEKLFKPARSARQRNAEKQDQD